MYHTPNTEPKIKKSLSSLTIFLLFRGKKFMKLLEILGCFVTHISRDFLIKIIDMNFHSFQNHVSRGSLSLLNEVDYTKTLALSGY